MLSLSMEQGYAVFLYFIPKSHENTENRSQKLQPGAYGRGSEAQQA